MGRIAGATNSEVWAENTFTGHGKWYGIFDGQGLFLIFVVGGGGFFHRPPKTNSCFRLATGSRHLSCDNHVIVM